MNDHQFSELLQKYLQGSIAVDEELQLRDAINSGEFDELTQREIEVSLRSGNRASQWEGERRQVVFEEISALLELQQPAGKKVYLRYWWAAAAVILVIGILWVSQPAVKLKPVAMKQTEVIVPAAEGAVLTLDDGRKVELDSIGKVMVNQGGIQTSIDSGRLTYAVNNTKVPVEMYNTISTPKGRQFSFTLPDGTRAWMNAASSIKFPISFSPKERRVSVSGEVYFEVANNAEQPFKAVVSDGTEIAVLGTSFNIKAYAAEKRSAITLVTGSVKVSTRDQFKLLQPGMQAVSSGTDLKGAPVDIEKVVAWKNGAFDFTDMPFEQAMNQLERWYDIDIIYDKSITDLPFAGRISNRTSLNSLLKILNNTSLQFRLEGRKLFINK